MVDNLNATISGMQFKWNFRNFQTYFMQFPKILSKYTFAIFNISFDSQIQEKSKICPDLEFLKDL